MTSQNIDDLELDEPPTIEPYEVLGLQKAATPDQVKSAYRKAALKHHPDKAREEDKEAAHSKFQEIALAYAILSDDRRRKRYDITGRTDESLDIDDDLFNWGDFYREQFKDIINPASISKFTEEYKGSDEEREALLAAYTKFKGNMTRIYEHVMVSNPAQDDDRFRELINKAIEDGEVEAYEKFTNEPKKSIRARIAAVKDEGDEAEEYAKELGVHDELFGDGKEAKAKGKKGGKKGAGGDEDALAALIQQRQKGRSDDFFANLEAKYGGGANKKKGGKKRVDPFDEPPEEAFEATAKRAKKAKSKSS